jgi:hypothetical protein
MSSGAAVNGDEMTEAEHICEAAAQDLAALERIAAAAGNSAEIDGRDRDWPITLCAHV